MARKFHSASSYELGVLCASRWLRRYVTYEPASAEADRSAADWGVALHEIAEYYWARGSIPPDAPLPQARTFLGMAAVMLADGVIPGDPGLAIERHIGTVPMVSRGEQITVLEYGGIKWSGKPDLSWLIEDTYDYKSCNSFRYIKDLTTDLAANLYALDAYERGADRVSLTWLYGHKETAECRPIRHSPTRSAAERIVLAATQVCTKLDSLPPDPDAPGLRNKDACWAFGKICEYHHTLGGNCVPPGSKQLTQISRKKKEQDMANAASAFLERKRAAAAAAAAGATAVEPTPDGAVETEGLESVEPEPDAAPEPTPTPKASAAATPGKAQALFDKAAKAREKRDEARAKLDAAQAALNDAAAKLTEALA